jgi:DNA-binding NarL/FixJ family response regulator
MSETPQYEDELPRRVPGSTVRIYLMDGSPIVRLGIHAILAPVRGLEIVGTAHESASLEDIQELAPDVVVVNSLSLSRELLDLVRRLSDRTSRLLPRILMIVGEQENSAFQRAGADADGTVQIRARPDEFVAAVSLVAAGYFIAAPQPWTAQADKAAAPQARASHWSTIKLLTQRELDVLRAVAQGRTNAEIARLMTVSESTVKSHVQNLLAKLGLPNRASAVAMAYKAGMLSG